MIGNSQTFTKHNSARFPWNFGANLFFTPEQEVMEAAKPSNFH